MLPAVECRASSGEHSPTRAPCSPYTPFASCPLQPVLLLPLLTLRTSVPSPSPGPGRLCRSMAAKSCRSHQGKNRRRSCSEHHHRSVLQASKRRGRRRQTLSPPPCEERPFPESTPLCCETGFCHPRLPLRTRKIRTIVHVDLAARPSLRRCLLHDFQPQPD